MMKRKLWKKIFAGVLSAVILFTNCGITSYAVEEVNVATTDGSFVLTAAATSETLIEPTVIDYHTGQTIRDAILSSEFTFEADESSGFITSIEGTNGSYSIVCSDGDYHLDRSPETISVVEFTSLTGSDLPTVENGLEVRTALILKMSEYLTAANNVQNYEPAKTAYNNALAGLRTEDADIAGLKAAFEAAISEYENLTTGDKVIVNIKAVQGETVLENPKCLFVDSYGTETVCEGTQAALVPGNYTFCVSDGAKNRVEGMITVSENTTLEVELPYGEWFGKIILGRKDENSSESPTIPYNFTQDFETNTAEYFITDISGDIFWGVERGTETPLEARPYACYVSTNNYDYSDAPKSWETYNLQLTKLLSNGMEGRTFTLEARNSYETADGNIYQMIQSFDIKVTRIPTCNEIIIKDGNGTTVFNEFNPEINEYTFNVTNDELEVFSELSDADNYSVSLDAAALEDEKIKLTEGENEFSITVAHSNGKTNTYTFYVTLVSSVNVLLNVPENVTAEVFNADGQVILPKEGTTEYWLIPEAVYYYIGTIDKEYHSTAQFTAAENLVIDVAEPEAKEILTDFALYDKSNYATRKVFDCDQPFLSSIYDYTYTVSDACSSVYAQATAEDGYTVTAEYEKTYSNANYDPKVMYSKNIDKQVDEKGGCSSLSYSIIASGFQRFIKIHVWKEIDGITYYQDYRLTLNRSLHLKELELLGEETITFLNEKDELQIFDRDIFEYYVNISAGIEKLDVEGSFINESDANILCGGYSLEIDGELYNNLSDAAITLNSELQHETKELKIYHKNAMAIQNVYKIHFTKLEPVKVSFDITPADAIVFVVNQMTNEPVFAENGTFELKPGVKYTYTVTTNGYLSQKATDYSVSGNEPITVSVAMKKADAGKEQIHLESKHPSFRFGDNNGIIDEKTPINSDDTVLYWATNQFKGTCGHPILVDDYLYVYDDERIYKLDTITGETVAVSEDALVRKSDFAIQTMTYGDGMLFVGLSKGTIQAFDAYTLESLWVYTDDLGGQANSTITYHNGYIYTGFWNGETAEANYVCISVTDENPNEKKEAKIASWVHKNAGGYYWAGAYVADEFLLVGTDDGYDGYRTGYAKILSIEPLTGRVIDAISLPHVGDVRCAITHDTDTGDYYFTSKGGFFYRISVQEDGVFVSDSLKYIELSNGTAVPSMSTSTPTIYNGRAYVGVSGSGQFSSYAGHNISVIDLTTMKVAYTVATQGYPQTSGVLTTAYEQSEEKAYVYFFDNYKPGKLRVLSDKPGQITVNEITTETYMVSGKEKTVDTGYVLFTPNGAQDEYALCTPIADEYGTFYFRNDSNYIMALGSTIEKIEVTKQPDKLTYLVGETFDPSGMEVTATYTNGAVRNITEYVSYSNASLTEDDKDFAITFEHVLYQDKNGKAGVEYTAPIAQINLEIITESFIVDTIEPQVYTGSALKPKPAVYNNGTLLKEGTDYTLSYKNNTNVGTAQVTVKGKGNFTNSIVTGFEIKAKSILDEDISITCNDKLWNGKEQKSYPTLKYGKITLKKDRDYTVEFSEELVNTGCVSVTLTGKGNYTGTEIVTYRITDKNIAKAVFVVTNTVYSGSSEVPVIPKLVVYADKKAQKNNQPLSERSLDADGGYTEGTYSVQYLNNHKAGKGQIVVTGCNTYGGIKTLNFTISKKKISSESIVVNVLESPVYNGKAQKPEISVYDVVNGQNVPLVEGTDYTLKYSNNTNAADTNVKKAPTITITGKGNYTGTKKVLFEILPYDLDESDEELAVTVADAKYNKKAQKPKVVVKLGTKTLKSGTDYKVSYSNNIDVSETEPTVIITGSKNYQGTITKSFRIYESSISSFVVDSIVKQTYTPHEKIEPEIIVYKNKSDQKIGPDYMLKQDEQYKIVSYTNNDKAGTGKITIEGCGIYGGSKTFSFKINKRTFTNVEVSLESELYTYCGSAIKPVVTVKDIDGSNEYVLKENVDYTLKYSNNVHAADMNSKKVPTVIITGKGNYSGTIKEYFAIEPKDINLEGISAEVKNVLFNQKKADSKTGITTSFTMKDGKKALKNKTNYKIVKYLNNKAVGEVGRYDSPTIVIEGTGNYCGTRNLEFRIYQTDISKAVVKVDTQYYTGIEVRPIPTSVTLKVGKETIALKNKDYKISYSNNVKCGKGKLTITGIGTYGGSKTVTFKILPKQIK